MSTFNFTSTYRRNSTEYPRDFPCTDGEEGAEGMCIWKNLAVLLAVLTRLLTGAVHIDRLAAE